MVTNWNIWQVMKPRRRRLVAAGAAVTLALGAAGGHWGPEWGLRWGVAKALHDLGWSKIGIGDADIALFDGAIVIRRVVARAPQGEASLGEALGIGGLDLTFRWKPLFSRRVSLEHLDLKGVEVEITRDGDGFVVNGLPVALGAGGESIGWTFDVTALTLTDSRIQVIDDGFRAAIAVERFELHDLRSWDAHTAASFRLDGRINGSRLVLAGTATPFADRAGFALRLDFDKLDLAAFAELARRAGVAPLAGRLSGTVSVDGAQGGGLRTEANVALSGLSASLARTGLNATSLDWRGGLSWHDGKVEAAGILRGTGMAVTDDALSVTAATAELNAKTLSYDGTRLSWDGRYEAEGQKLVQNEVAVSQRRLGWTGQVDFDLAAKAPHSVRVTGRVEADDMAIQSGPLAIAARKVSAEGNAGDAPARGLLPPGVGTLSLAAEGLSITEPGRDWLAVQHLEARDLRLGADGPGHVARLEAKGFAALGHKGKGAATYPWRIEARSLILDRANLAADGAMTAESVTLGGAMLRVTRAKDGFVGLASRDGTSSERPRLAIGRLRLAPDARLDFDDRTTSEPVRLRAEGIELTMSELDSGRPDRDSPFSLKARIGAARLAASGKARPFADHPGGDIAGDIRALELPPLSPYAADALGVHLHTGQLDAEFSLAARQGKLDGALQLVLNQMFVARPDPAAPLAKQADMPLETVLDLLRDGDNRIRLSIPVRGDLDAPDFDISDAVNQAIGGALKSTMVTTLKVAFPVAALIGFVIDEAENPRLSLEPLAFPPGADTLAEVEQRKLATVANLLGQRPGLKLTLCGIASQQADWPVLMRAKREEELGIIARLQTLMGTGPKPEAVPIDRDRLAGLAESRAQSAKAFLVETAGIDPGRLFTCRPKVEGDGPSGSKTGPRVDLLL